jgi:hypothetical protein
LLLLDTSLLGIEARSVDQNHPTKPVEASR